MAEKDKACKNCGCLTNEKECPTCKSKQFVEKFKGKAILLEATNSIVADKMEKKVNGKFAIKYG